MFLEETKRIAWLGLVQVVLYASGDVVELSLVSLERGKVFLDLLQRLLQSCEFRLVVDRW